MLKKIEAFLNIFYKTKGRHVFSLFLGMCIPFLPVQTFMAFFLAIRALGKDIENKSIISLLSLPFRRRELFILFWIIGLFLITVATFVSWIFVKTISLYSLIYLFVFFTFYYGVATFFASKERSVFGMTLLVLIVDAIFLSIPGYPDISVITQANSLYSSLFALFALGLGYYEFVYKYEG